MTAYNDLKAEHARHLRDALEASQSLKTHATALEQCIYTAGMLPVWFRDVEEDVQTLALLAARIALLEELIAKRPRA